MVVLSSGYRHIHLLGNKGESLGYATLFVHIELNGGSKTDRSSYAVRKISFLFVCD